MTNQEPKKRSFYWVEGVTRKEVEWSLTDRTPSRFRQQGPRRVLVGIAVAALIAMAINAFVPGVKLASYLEIICLLTVAGAYLKLRSAVRQVSDAPDELLDERQIAVRNAAYLVAYRWLAMVSLAVVVLLIAASDGKLLGWEYREVLSGDLHRLAIAFVFFMGILPAAVLAWQLPSEPQDEPN